MKLLHRIFKGHWPVYKKLGYDRWGFDLHDDECEICKGGKR